MSTEDIDGKPEHERFNMFLDTWNKLKATNNFVPSQEEADRVAAMFNVKAPKVAQQEHIDTAAVAKANADMAAEYRRRYED